MIPATVDGEGAVFSLVEEMSFSSLWKQLLGNNQCVNQGGFLSDSLETLLGSSFSGPWALAGNNTSIPVSVDFP